MLFRPTSTLPSFYHMAESTEKKTRGVAALLGTMPLGKVIWLLTYPAFIGKICEGMFTVIDTIFIGQYVGSTPEERSVALASIAFAMPIDSAIITGIALWISHGTNPVYGASIGKGDLALGRRVLGNLAFLCLFFGILIPIVYPLFIPGLLRLMGASEVTGTFQLAYDYIMVLVYGSISISAACSFNSIARSEGSALYSLLIVVVAHAGNALFCFIFLALCRLGVQGASFSTIIAESLSAIVGMYYFTSKRAIVCPHWKDLMPNFKVLVDILNAGLSSFFLGVAPSLLTVFTNRLILHYSIDPESVETTAALAASGSLSKISSFCLMPITSLALGSTSIMAYCRGAGLYERYTQTFKTCLFIQILISLLLTVIGYFCSTGIARLFGGDEIFVSIFSLGIQYTTSGLVFLPIVNILGPVLQTTGRGYIGGILVFLRSCIYPILFQFLFCYLRNDYYGAFIAQPFAEFLSALTAFGILFFIKDDIDGKRKIKKHASNEEQMKVQQKI